MKSWKSLCVMVGAVVLIAAGVAAVVVFHEKIKMFLNGAIDNCDCFIRDKFGRKMHIDEYDDYADDE